MRALLTLSFGLLLTACSHYEPPALHGAASMRVEVEVYKGPLTVSPAGQVGQLVAEVSDSIRAVSAWNQRADAVRTEKCTGDPLDKRDCRQLLSAINSAGAILGATCYLLKSPTLTETVGRGVYIPWATCDGAQPPSETAAGRARVELRVAEKASGDADVAYVTAKAQFEIDQAAAEVALDQKAHSEKTLRRRKLDAELAPNKIAVARESAENAAQTEKDMTATSNKKSIAAEAASQRLAATDTPENRTAADKANKEKADAVLAAVEASKRKVAAAELSIREKNAADQAVADQKVAEEDFEVQTAAEKVAAERAKASLASLAKSDLVRAAAKKAFIVKKDASKAADAEAQAARTDAKTETNKALAAVQARLETRQAAVDACLERNSRPGASAYNECQAVVSAIFGPGKDQEPTSLSSKEALDLRLNAFKSCLGTRQAISKCRTAILKNYGVFTLDRPRPAASFQEDAYAVKLDQEIDKCIEENSKSIVDQLACQRDVITVAFTNTATILTTAADRSSDAYVRGAPQDPEIRSLLVQFGQMANEYGAKMAARTIVLAKMMADGKPEARNLPVSDYLRGADATEYLQLFDWLKAADEDKQDTLRVGKLNVPERIRMAQRLASDENWQKVNEVYASGQGEVGMAFIKDELGNWNLKSFSSDPTELLAAYRNVTSAALKTAAQLTAKAAAGPAGTAAERISDATKATVLANQLATGGVPATPGVVGGVNISAMHARTARQLDAQKTRFVAQENQLISDLAAQSLAVTAAENNTAQDKVSVSSRQTELANAEKDRDAANDRLQTVLAVIRAKEAAGSVVLDTDRIAATSARDEYAGKQRLVATAAGAVTAAQATVEKDLTNESEAKAKKAATAQRLADLSKDAIESLRGTLDQYAGVIADLQSGVAAAAPAGPKVP